MHGWTRSTASLGLASLWLVGCSELAKVSENATAIQAESQALIDHGRMVGDKEVVTRAGRIHDLAVDIHGRIPHLEDKTPVWLSTLWWAAAAVALIAVAVILWQTGLGAAVRVAIGWLPRKKVAQAELAADMLDPNSPEGDREMIAFMRSQDAEFDAAFKRAVSRRKKGTT